MSNEELNTCKIKQNDELIICSDLDKLKEGIGEKLSIFTYLVMSFTISVIFSFFYGWKLTLVILSCAPIIILATAIVAKVCDKSVLNSHYIANKLHFFSDAKHVNRKGIEGIFFSWSSCRRSVG